MCDASILRKKINAKSSGHYQGTAQQQQTCFLLQNNEQRIDGQRIHLFLGYDHWYLLSQ